MASLKLNDEVLIIQTSIALLMNSFFSKQYIHEHLLTNSEKYYYGPHPN